MTRVSSKIKLVLSLILVISMLLPSGMFYFSNAEEIVEPIIEQQTADYKELTEELVENLKNDSKIFDYIDEEEFTNQGHIARLYELEEDNSYAFKNADSTRSIYFLADAVKYVDESGVLTEKDISLVKSGDDYKIKKNSFGLTLPKYVTQGISFTASSDTIVLYPEVHEQDSSEIVIDEEKNTASYPCAFGQGTALRYTPTLYGVKEDIILEQRIDKATYMFEINAGNLNLYESEGRYYFAAQENAQRQISLGEIWVYDSEDHFVRGTMEVTETTQDVYSVTVIVPESFLNDEKTVYPVYIDPSIEEYIIDAGSNIKKIEDATVFEGAADTSFGGMYYCTVAWTPEYGRGRTAVRFPGLYTSSAYAGIAPEQIDTVEFRIKEASGNNGNSVQMYPMQSSWSESSVTWNNLGSYSSTCIDTVALYSGAYSAFDITDYCIYNKGTTAEQYGFLLKGTNETIKQKFYSSEYQTNYMNYRPYIYLVYNAYIDIDGSAIRYTAVDESLALHATLHPDNFDCIWSVSGSSNATVTGNGANATITCTEVSTLTVTATAYFNDAAVGYDTCTVQIIPLTPTDYYIESAASNNNSQAFIKPNNHSAANEAQIIANTMFNVDDAQDVEGSNENCIWKLTYYTSGGYYTFKFEENNKYLGYASNDSIKQYTTSSADSRKFTITETVSGYYKICPIDPAEAGKAIKLENLNALPKNLELGTYSNDNNFDDEWIFHRVLPRSGGERRSHRLGSHPNQQTNCYAYAFSAGVGFPTMIGESFNPNGLQNASNAQDVINAVLNDAEIYFFDAAVIGRFETCDSNTYKVAVLISGYGTNVFDFHWYRQCVNGIWCGQNGTSGSVSNTDSSNHIVFDPYLAYESSYPVFISYFQATPCN